MLWEPQRVLRLCGWQMDIAKNAADQITLTNDEDGVADAIERLIFN